MPSTRQQSQVPVLCHNSRRATRMTTTTVSIVALWWLVGDDVGGASVALELQQRKHEYSKL